MSIHFRCIDCYAVLGISDSQAGKGVTCPQCRYRSVVPFRSDPTLRHVCVAEPLTDFPRLLASSSELISPASDSAPTDPQPSTALKWMMFSGGSIGLLLMTGVMLLSFVSVNDLLRPLAALSQNAAKEDKGDLARPAPQPARPVIAEMAAQTLVVPDEQPAKLTPSPHAKAISEVESKATVALANKSSVPAHQQNVKLPPPDVKPKAAKIGDDIARAAKNDAPKRIYPATPVGYTEKELRDQLQKAPQISLAMDRLARARFILRLTDLQKQEQHSIGPVLPQGYESIVKGLPLKKGSDCMLPHETAKQFTRAALQLLGAFMQAERLKSYSGFNAENSISIVFPEAGWNEGDIRAAVQMLQAEKEPTRRVLIDALAKTKGALASRELARRAVLDVSPNLREAARKELRKRRAEEFQQTLAKYFNHPWPPAAVYASEAILELNVKKAVPALIAQLKQPDITLPRLVNEDGKKHFVVPQLVRINHLKNCALCHATIGNASGSRLARTTADGMIIGAVPDPERSLPTRGSGAYYRQGDLFVRADVTYLRQDFSITQPVKDAVNWPLMQRFDFVVRSKAITDTDAKMLRARYDTDGPSLQRQILLYTLQRLTGRNPGMRHEDWLPLLYKEGG